MRPISSILRRKRGGRYWLRLLLVGLAGGGVMFCAGYEAVYVDALTRPARSAVCCLTPADLGFGYQDATLTSGTVKLAAWYLPSQNGAAVVLLHGYGGNRMEMLSRAAMLARHGYGVLLYDLRAHGQSGGDLRTWGWLDVQDVAAALTFLQRRADVVPERIGILGFSVGGQVALRAAAQMLALKAAAADGPSIARVEDVPPLISLPERGLYAVYWVGDRLVERRTGVFAPAGVTEVIAQIAPRPLLLISTGTDMEQRTARHYYALAGEPKMLWEIPEAGHGGGPAARPDEYEGHTVAFFDQALLADSRPD